MILSRQLRHGASDAGLTEIIVRACTPQGHNPLPLNHGIAERAWPGLDMGDAYVPCFQRKHDWLPDMDSNHDSRLQRPLSYR